MKLTFKLILVGTLLSSIVCLNSCKKKEKETIKEIKQVAYNKKSNRKPL